MRSLELFLLQPLPDSAERTRFEGLRRLLSRGRALSTSGETPEGALMQKFGVSRQRDWPVAPLARLGDKQEPNTGYWLCADPVHLQVDRDALILVDSHRYELAQTDADSLVSALNLHFDAAGMHFSAPTPMRWYARVAQTPDVQTVSLREAAGRNVDLLLPSGGDALAWHRTFNEIQMLLHNHPVNEAREARGELPVNSVWLWGGGTLPAHVAGEWVHVWATDALARGLARAAKIDCADTPGGFTSWLEQARDGEHLVVLEDADLDRTESGWLAPALHALRARLLSRLSLSASVGSEVLRFDLTRGDLWKFWRRSPAVAA
jgi:hypothetical protein